MVDNTMKGSLSIAKPFGIRVFVHWTFSLLIVWILGSTLMAGATVSLALQATFFVLAVFGCVILHELGHALAARRYGIGTEHITLWPIGGVAALDRMPRQWKQELVIAIAGPAVNVAIIAILLPFVGSLQIGGILLAAMDGSFIAKLLVANVLLVVFNLIPAFPMDGGRVLRALLSAFGNPAKATHIAARIGQVIAIGFILLGLTGNLFLIIIGGFILLAAEGERRSVLTNDVLRHFAVKDAMTTHTETLNANDLLSSAINSMFRSLQEDFPVVDDTGYVGFLSRAEMLRALREGRGWERVGEIVPPDIGPIRSNIGLDEAFQLVQKAPASSLPVVDNGMLIGLLPASNIYELLVIRECEDNWTPDHEVSGAASGHSTIRYA